MLECVCTQQSKRFLLKRKEKGKKKKKKEERCAQKGRSEKVERSGEKRERGNK